MSVLVLGSILAAIPASGESVDPSCAKVEEGAVGAAGATVDAGGVAVTFTSWRAKPGEAGEYVGFDYSAEGGSLTVITVKAGRELHDAGALGSTGTWDLPEGQRRAVSHVVVCAARRDGSGGID